MRSDQEGSGTSTNRGVLNYSGPKKKTAFSAKSTSLRKEDKADHEMIAQQTENKEKGGVRSAPTELRVVLSRAKTHRISTVSQKFTKMK